MQLFVKSLIATSLSIAIASPTVAGIEINGDTSHTISSPGGNVPINGTLVIGQSGSGEGAVDSGSVLDTTDITVGSGANSTGTLTVTGNGSVLNNENRVHVGKLGNGVLNITDGGTVNTSLFSLGSDVSGNGLGTVSGTDSSLNTQLLLVGQEGNGNLHITNGAVVKSTWLTEVGLGGRGNITVDGQAQLSTSELNLGSMGGTLDISGGGRVDAGLMTIYSDPAFVQGAYPLAHESYANVSGEGSMLNANDIMIGNGDFGGALTVSDNATVNAGSITLGLMGDEGVTSSLNIGGQKGLAATAAGHIVGSVINLASADAELNFNHTDNAYRFDSTLTGEGIINNLSGVTMLGVDNTSFLGTANVIGGTLVSSQGLGGDVNIDAAGTMIASESIGGNVTNAGILKVGTVTADGSDVENDARRLEIKGDYTGNNGTLILDTALGNDDSSTDFLNIYGNTYGTTNVVVNNMGGSGAQTLNGISVIRVGGESAGDFIQQGRIAAGAFDYLLARNGSDWVLSSSLTPEPEPEVKPESKPNLKNMAVRPEAGAYSTNMAASNTLFNTRLHDRLGETHYMDELTGEHGVTSLWMRHEGGHNRSKDSSGQLKTTANRYVMQLGGDIAQWSSTGEDRFHLGVMGGYANQKSKSHNTYTGHTANGDLSGFSTGLYGMWLQDNADKTGAYVDSWVQYNWFNNTVNGDTLSAERYKSKGLTASVESGYTLKLGDISTSDSAYIQPKAQATWMGVKADKLQENNGTHVKGTGDGNIQTRLGVRAFIKHEDGEQKFEPFVEANWLHNTRAFGTSLDGVEISQVGTRDIGELKAGVEGKMSRNFNLWGNVAQQVGDKGYSDTSATIGLKVSF